jgi:Putative peptidoglycan binding domain
MAQFTFSADHLKKSLEINCFSFSSTGMILFGIRGAILKSSTANNFQFSHSIEKVDVDYLSPKCIIGIWKPNEKLIALFSASTVPHLDYIRAHFEHRAKANAMMPGYYSFFEKGFHNPADIRRAHEALRLATNIAFRRSTNDLKFENNDDVEVGNPNDNMHASYSSNLNTKYSSAGCQVIVGQPKCEFRGITSENTGEWKAFHDIIYGNSLQTKFDYCLLRGIDAEFMAINATTPLKIRLRFGSEGDFVKNLQTKLTERGFFKTNIDGGFGKNTLRAVLDFQTKTFGISEADGVVGKNTAAALSLELPLI